MSSNRFLTIASNGVKRLVTAIATRVDAATSGDKILRTRSDGFIDSSFFPPGIGGEPTITRNATENLAAGDFVNVFSGGVRKADASNNRRARGFVLTAVTNGSAATVYLRGENTALTGITVDAEYFLSASAAGTATVTMPSANGNISQRIGYGVSTNSIMFEEDEAYEIFS